MKSILNGVTLGTVHWAEIHDPAMVQVTAGHTFVEMHVTDLAEALREDPMLSAMLDWLKSQKQTNLKMLLEEHTSSEEGKLVLWSCQNFTIHQGALYLSSMPKAETEDLLLFTVPKVHCATELNGCH